MKSYLLFTLCIMGMLVSGCQTPQSKEQEKGIPFSKRFGSLKINEIQVLGTHNSYAQPIDSHVMAFVAPIVDPMMEKRLASMPSEQLAEYQEYHPNKVSMMEALSYNHPPLVEQLESGLRSLEIDVYYDPTGKRFNSPASYTMLEQQGVDELLPHDTTGLGEKGFKVLHIADFDFRSHCPTLADCLGELKTWSDQNPNHVPVFILLEVKQQGLPIFPNPTEVVAFDSLAFDALDQEILEVLGRNKLITPDDVRGDYPSLEDAVKAHNYPTLKEAKGKFLFLMLPAIDENAASLYWKGRPSLEGRMMFVRSTPGVPRAAFLLLDNAIMREADIKQRVADGYLVRTRSDIETYEAKVNDYSRAEAAFRSGAQIVSTDYFLPGNNYGTSYMVSLPGGLEARPNPIIKPVEE